MCGNRRTTVPSNWTRSRLTVHQARHVLRVLDQKLASANQPDRYKLWINPEQNYVVLRAETAVFKSTNPPKLAYIDTEIFEALARSPSGHWYPTRVVRTTSNFPGKQVRKYFLEFHAPIPDELFRPLGP